MSTIEPLYSTLRFVSSSGPPSSGKRRIAQHACDRCRQRKKRCFNGDNAVTDDAGDAGRVSSTEPGDADATKNTNHHILDVASGMIDVSNGNAASNSHPRYIGDLNPEVELLAATEPNQVPKNSTGVWHSESVQNSHESGDKHVAAPWSILHGLPLGTQESLLPLLRQQCLETIPTRENFLELERYYFERIHSLLPSIDEAIYRSSLVGSPTENLQKQCVCLLASTSLSMRQYLRLGNDLRTLQPNEYARRVVGAMRLIIDLALVTDKIVLIYALTTMSLFVYGRESLELTSQYFFRAVQVAYSIGLHQPRDTKQDEKVAGMFSYIWSIDRLHAAMQGRPIVMHEIDMAKSPLSCAVDQQAGFKVLVHIAALLDKVIGLYRPTALRKEIPDEEFPLFEEVLEKCNALTLRACDQASLELFYHAVAVLSCRYSSGPAMERSHIRNARQTSSTTQILAILDKLDPTNTAMLPFVPYAVSLAMSTAYHDFRHGKASTRRERAWKNFVKSHRHLAPLGIISWSAAFMSDLASKLLQEAQSRRETRPSSPVTESQPNHPTMAADQNASLNVAEFSMDEFMTDINLDLDGLFEGALDPSMPWQFQDTSYSGSRW